MGSLLMVLPPEKDIVPERSPPRLNFAADTLTEVRPKDVGAPRTVADMMLHSGMKVVHAIARGTWGGEADLEKSRRRLLEMGFVDKANFGNEPDDQQLFRDERRANLTTLDRTERERLQELSSGRAYDQWASQKESREQALIYLAVAKLPALQTAAPSSRKAALVNSNRAGGAPTSVPPVPPPSYHLRGASSAGGHGALKESSVAAALRPFPVAASSLGRGAAGGTAASSLTAGPLKTSAAVAEILDVGKALKKVDRTLFTAWSKWCESVISPGAASVLWDAFYPTACDLHGMVGSDVSVQFPLFILDSAVLIFISVGEECFLARFVCQLELREVYGPPVPLHVRVFRTREVEAAARLAQQERRRRDESRREARLPVQRPALARGAGAAAAGHGRADVGLRAQGAGGRVRPHGLRAGAHERLPEVHLAQEGDERRRPGHALQKVQLDMRLPQGKPSTKSTHVYICAFRCMPIPSCIESLASSKSE